ncbi:3-methyl-2-oxobutanoate hydroxymethyltransferase [Brevibacterium jeotgali]
MYTAQIVDEAGIPVLLVGDSASNNVYGHDSSLPVTVDEPLPLVLAASRSVIRSLVLADLPFGSYQWSPEQAFRTAARLMKETGADRLHSAVGASVGRLPHAGPRIRSGCPPGGGSRPVRARSPCSIPPSTSRSTYWGWKVHPGCP